MSSQPHRLGEELLSQLNEDGQPVSKIKLREVLEELLLLHGRSNRDVIDVRDFGAVGDGRHDDTDGLDRAAREYAARAGADNRMYRPPAESWRVAGARLYIPAGVYRYRGGGIDLSAVEHIDISGDGPTATRIVVETESTFMSMGRTVSANIRELSVQGGRAHFYWDYRGPNVTRFHRIHDCAFINFSEVSVGFESENFPNIFIERCEFVNYEKARGIGVASNGLTDLVCIEKCQFIRVRHGVKLGGGGSNARVRDCFFAAPPSTGSSIWIVPADAQQRPRSQGQGLVIEANKFGTETDASHGVRILMAKEAASPDSSFAFSSDPATNLAGVLSSVTIGPNNTFASTMKSSAPVVENRVAKLFNFRFLDNVFYGAIPENVFRDFSFSSNPAIGADSYFRLLPVDRRLLSQPRRLWQPFYVSQPVLVDDHTLGVVQPPTADRADGAYFTAVLSARVDDTEIALDSPVSRGKRLQLFADMSSNTGMPPPEVDELLSTLLSCTLRTTGYSSLAITVRPSPRVRTFAQMAHRVRALAQGVEQVSEIFSLPSHMSRYEIILECGDPQNADATCEFHVSGITLHAIPATASLVR